MADIFLSYASQDHEKAKALAHALIRHGWSVWWDRNILAGSSFRDVIAQELMQARCVVVLWSRHALRSDWVPDEADVARKRKRLVPVLLEAVDPPLGFAGIQTADLAKWSGDPLHPGLDRLLVALEGILGRPSATPPARIREIRQEKVAARKRFPQGVWPLMGRLSWHHGAVASFLAVLVAGVGFLIWLQQPDGPPAIVDRAVNSKPTTVVQNPTRLGARSVRIWVEGRAEFYINGRYEGTGSTIQYRGQPGERFDLRISKRGYDKDIRDTLTVGEQDRAERYDWPPE